MNRRLLEKFLLRFRIKHSKQSLKHYFSYSFETSRDKQYLLSDRWSMNIGRIEKNTSHLVTEKT